MAQVNERTLDLGFRGSFGPTDGDSTPFLSRRDLGRDQGIIRWQVAVADTRRVVRGAHTGSYPRQAQQHTSSEMAAHYDIFRHHLWATAPAYGHALWDPDLGNLYPAVKAGDVGYIREDYYEQLTLDKHDHINTGLHNPQEFSLTSVA